MTMGAREQEPSHCFAPLIPAPSSTHLKQYRSGKGFAFLSHHTRFFTFTGANDHIREPGFTIPHEAFFINKYRFKLSI